MTGAPMTVPASATTSHGTKLPRHFGTDRLRSKRDRPFRTTNTHGPRRPKKVFPKRLARSPATTRLTRSSTTTSGFKPRPTGAGAAGEDRQARRRHDDDRQGQRRRRRQAQPGRERSPRSGQLPPARRAWPGHGRDTTTARGTTTTRRGTTTTRRHDGPRPRPGETRPRARLGPPRRRRLRARKTGRGPPRPQPGLTPATGT